MNGKHSEIRNAGRRALALLVAALLAAGLVPAPALAQVADELDALAIEVQADDAIVSASGTSRATSTPGGATNDELMAAYVEHRFAEQLPGGGEPELETQSAAEHLSGNEATLYEKLRPLVASVAAGTRQDTTLSVSVSEFEGQKSWTAAELGVDALVSGGQFTQEAVDAFGARVEALVDYGRVMYALLADCPYDLYWYDKVAGIGMAYGISGNSSSMGLAGDVTFTLSVAAGYSAGDCLVDPSAAERVGSAAELAASIAADHASKPASSRLASYKEKVCELASYNRAAAQGGVGYGDPWQLVWVFDGDPATTVVCEGYAKAFKYLCDLSGADDVECLLATGYMSDTQQYDPEADGHMWNVARMPDGKSYLVDVTNCDEGSVGSPDLLFLKGFASGTPDTWYQFATAGATSKTYYTYDGDARSAFADSELTLSAKDYDPASDAPQRLAIAPEVTIQGWTYGEQPSQPTLAEGSNPGGGEVTFEYKAQDAEDEDYAPTVPANAGDYTVRATVAETDAYLGGTATANFTIAKATPDLGEVSAPIVRCDLDATKVELERTNASVAGTLSLDATMLDAGTHTYAWTFAPTDVANYEQATGTVVIAAYDHDPKDSVRENEVLATCEQAGSYDEVVYCAACGRELSREPRATNALGHDYVSTVFEPTWDDAGYTLHKCTRCGEEHRTDELPPLKDTQPRSISDALVATPSKTYTYSGKALTPTPTVTLDGTVLEAGTDYDVLPFQNNVNAGTATITIQGKGAYTGTASGTFNIAKAASTIRLTAQTKTYTGKSLSYNGKVSRSGSGGKVTYAYYTDAKCTKAVKAANVKAAGTYYVKATLAADANHKAATSAAAKFSVAKAANTLTVKAVSAKHVASAKKNTSIAASKAFKVTKNVSKGKVTYKKASGNAKITISSAGKVVVKKGLKKGTYVVKAKATSASTANYKAASKTVSFKVVVK